LSEKKCVNRSALAIAESSKEAFEEESLSGSMLSLAHSNSSSSFPL
jgi:thousand and one amino acid protein kinase